MRGRVSNWAMSWSRSTRSISKTIVTSRRCSYALGEWSRATYHLERDGAQIETTVVIAPRSERFESQFAYLEIIGILHLLVGIFVISKRWRAPHAVHFYWVCLISFVLYVFQSTGKFNDFDWTIFWSNQAAYVFLPPLFMHFCLEFPLKKTWIQNYRFVLPLLYVPGGVLLVMWVAFVTGVLGFIPSPLVLRHMLDGVTDFHFGVFFIASAAILMHTYRTVQEPELRQQMKWVTRGTVVAVVPYFLFQSLPRMLGMVPSQYADIAVFPLVFIPISFGYAIHRYRLMDVDILFKRGMAYTLATAAVVGFYITVVVVVGKLFGESLPQQGVIAPVVATIIAALLLAPTKDQIQTWLDKFFYKDRYNLRLTVTDFRPEPGHRDRSANRARPDRRAPVPDRCTWSRWLSCSKIPTNRRGSFSHAPMVWTCRLEPSTRSSRKTSISPTSSSRTKSITA